MKPRCSNRGNYGLTMIEVLALIFVTGIVLLLLAAMLLPDEGRIKYRLDCVNNLKEASLAYRIWEGDNGGLYPTGVSVTNGGAMELAAKGDVSAIFQVMSNELSTPKILICPDDTNHFAATNFAVGFSSRNLSYFASLDATNDSNPHLPLTGDDNFDVGSIPVKSGLLSFPANPKITWSASRHKHMGNVAITDGSVQQLTTAGLQQVLQNSGLATNHLAIP